MIANPTSSIPFRNFYSRTIPVLCLLTLSVFQSSSNAEILTTFTRPAQETSVATSESGVIVSQLVEEGQAVKKGQVLASLNNSTLVEAKRLATVRAESTIKIRAAESNLNMRRTHWESLAELLEKGHGNQREVDIAKLQLESAQAELELALELREEATIELARINADLDLREIRSPMDGIVVIIHKEPGEYIAANDPIYCSVVRTDCLRADFYLNMSALVEIRELIQAGEMQLPVRLKLGADRDRDFIVQARLIYASPTLDAKSETGRVTVEIDNREQKILSGCRCELLLSIGKGNKNSVGSSKLNRNSVIGFQE